MAEESIWFRLGYALEQTRASSPPRLRSLAGRVPGPARQKDERGRPRRPASDPEGPDALDALLVAGGGALVARLLEWWTPRRRPGFAGLLKGGAAGAGAAVIRELVHPLLHGELRAPEWDGELGEKVLSGVARGFLYASVVEPRLPGPLLARAIVFGAAEYAVAPWGGFTSLLGGRAPHRRIPFVSSLFEGLEPEDDALVDHVAFAVALAVLYGAAEGSGEDVEVVEVG